VNTPTAAHAAAVHFATVDAGSPNARSAMSNYFAELDRRLAGGFGAGTALEDAATAFNPPAGMFVIATVDDALVGCGAISWLDDETGEVKRMWVDADVRGIGLGKRLLGRLEDEIRASGRTRVVLDTNEALVEAIAMYRRLGYCDIDPYNDNPHAHHWFEKSLA
jgi:GNAT superfamily N-acetyltransferase